MSDETRESGVPIGDAIRENERRAKQDEVRRIVNGAIAATRHTHMDKYGKWGDYHCAACSLLHLTSEVIARRLSGMFTTEEQKRFDQGICARITDTLPRPIIYEQGLQILRMQGVEWGDWPFTCEQMEESLKQPHIGVNPSEFDFLAAMIKDAKDYVVQNLGQHLGTSPALSSPVLAALLAAVTGGTIIPLGGPLPEGPKKKDKKGKKGGR